MSLLRYNEPSWKIDIISEINSYVSGLDLKIKRAGGEHTITSGSRHLFPDVILFSGSLQLDILQGWELKFPDTSITNNEFIHNAIEKASNLKVNSFLLWNVSSAVLYVKTNKDFQPYKSWNDLLDINRRDQVESNKSRWIELLHHILLDLNNFLNDGIITTDPFVGFSSVQNVIDIILRNYDELTDYLKSIAATDSVFESEVNNWWRSSHLEYPHEKQPWAVLSKNIILSWINKFLFAHVLKTYFNPAGGVNDIKRNTSIDEAIRLFDIITQQNDFWSIFNLQLGSKYLTNRIWNDLLEFNEFLIDLKLDDIQQDVLRAILELTVNINKRKTVGQFTTPIKLAELLVRMTIDNREGTIYDPCCGTGTIVKAAYNLKHEYNIQEVDIINSIWMSDKFSYPLQISSLSLAKPENINQVIRIFKKDIIDLKVGDNIQFKHPSTGNSISIPFERVQYIVSNLPFVQQEDIKELNPNINQINDMICDLTGSDIGLDGRSDLYTYIPFYLWDKITDSGRAGIITSNSWLGTDMGKRFRNILRMFFNIDCIIISNSGRWFKNSDVITILTIMTKKDTVCESDSNYTKFLSVNVEINDNTNVKDFFDLINTNTICNSFDSYNYSANDIDYFESFGLEWSAFFADISWLRQAENKLCPASNYFEINRGERRGWDPLFYPDEDNEIEEQYLKPVLKSSKKVTHLMANPDAVAFCCSNSIEQLEQYEHIGAIKWIRRFEHQVNERGVPLHDVLARPNLHWYEMKDSTVADLFGLINYDKRLFIAKMRERGFVNQRLIRFTLKPGAEMGLDIFWALMNRLIGIFFIEALGFGRGLGALDLSSRKFSNGLKLLNPRLLDNNQIRDILSKFNVLIDRPILNIKEELLSEDRIDFDNKVLECFDLLDIKNNIIDSILKLYSIRTTVRD